MPVSGRDEMAGLASEFNKMSDRLADQMDELRRQQIEIDESIRRIGEAFASGLDRQALLEIVVETAVGACKADYGLIALERPRRRGGRGGEGDRTGVQDAALAAESRALRERRAGRGLAGQGVFAFASSLRPDRATAGEPVGVMTMARAATPFTTAERDVFLYLVGQAAASIENVALHELVSEQAVTDDLTGLSNKRAFRDADREGGGARRALRPCALRC